MFSWPNFTIVKYNSKISIIYHQIKISKRYNKQVFNKTNALKNFAIFTEKHLRWSHLLNKNAGLQSWNFIKKRLDQYVFGLPRTPKSLIPFFTSKHTFFTSNNAIFNIITHTHFFLYFLIKQNPLKIGIQGNNLHIFLWYLKIWVFF